MKMNGKERIGNSGEISRENGIERQKRKLEAFYLSGGNYDAVLRQADARVGAEEKEKVLDMLQEGQVSKNLEYNLLRHIKGPMDVAPGETARENYGRIAGRIAQSKDEQVILAYMTNSRWDEGQRVFGQIEAFKQQFPNPMDFEERSEAFIRRVAEANTHDRARVQDYVWAMNKFKRDVYGKKQEYWEAMKDLHREAKERGERQERFGAQEKSENIEGGEKFKGTRERFRKIGERTKRILGLGEKREAKERESLVREVGTRSLNKGELTGRPERENEDQLFENRESGLFGVFDGMGGLNGGAMASQIAAHELAFIEKERPIETRGDLARALGQISEQIKRSVQGGGSTGSIGKIVEREGKKYMAFAQVGDSRIYRVRKGEAELLTQDEGFQNLLTNYLGRPDGLPPVQTGIVELKKGDNLVFCSDGITGDLEKDFIPEPEFAQLVEKAETAQEAADNLVKRATKVDDRTAVVVRV